MTKCRATAAAAGIEEAAPGRAMPGCLAGERATACSEAAYFTALERANL